MSFIQFEMIERGPVPGIIKRDLNKLLKVGWLSIGRLWHSQMRRKHFTREGARLYRYARRTDVYERRKRREKGHDLPLVWTGRSRRATRIRDIRATSKGVKVVMRAPALNLTRLSAKARGRKSMREELTTVSRKEVKQLAEHYERVLERVINRIRTKRTTVIRG